ncbi:hypothetical protein IWX48DRAFT_617015 [Phyllosticta citricarpa]
MATGLAHLLMLRSALQIFAIYPYNVTAVPSSRSSPDPAVKHVRRRGGIWLRFTGKRCCRRRPDSVSGPESPRARSKSN